MRKFEDGQRFAIWAVLTVIVTVFAGLATTACGGDDAKTSTATIAAATSGTSTAATPAPTKVVLKGDITVFAAASLTDSFKEAGKAFEAANPDAHVAFNFAGSSALATQINQGAPADVFASADGTNMRLVSDKGSTEPQTIFATNIPVVVVPASGSPVKAFEDLAKPGTKLVLAAPAVPIGNYARDIFNNASAASGGISPDFSSKTLANLKSNEADVKAVLAKVQVGEADAGVVYKTDASAAGNQVKTIDIPTKYNVIAEYPIAVMKTSGKIDVARGFVAFITSEPGQTILAKNVGAELSDPIEIEAPPFRNGNKGPGNMTPHVGFNRTGRTHPPVGSKHLVQPMRH